VLLQYGSVFEFREEGEGAMGPFAWGEFVHGDRRLELHYRRGLGLVTYHALAKKATHEAYIKKLGLWETIVIPVLAWRTRRLSRPRT
jgi:hypothetical protein